MTTKHYEDTRTRGAGRSALYYSFPMRVSEDPIATKAYLQQRRAVVTRSKERIGTGRSFVKDSLELLEQLRNPLDD